MNETSAVVLASAWRRPVPLRIRFRHQRDGAVNRCGALCSRIHGRPRRHFDPRHTEEYLRLLSSCRALRAASQIKSASSICDDSGGLDGARRNEIAMGRVWFRSNLPWRPSCTQLRRSV
jgi:hypothetical protein